MQSRSSGGCFHSKKLIVLLGGNVILSQFTEQPRCVRCSLPSLEWRASWARKAPSRRISRRRRACRRLCHNLHRREKGLQSRERRPDTVSRRQKICPPMRSRGRAALLSPDWRTLSGASVPKTEWARLKAFGEPASAARRCAVHQRAQRR